MVYSRGTLSNVHYRLAIASVDAQMSTPWVPSLADIRLIACLTHYHLSLEQISYILSLVNSHYASLQPTREISPVPPTWKLLPDFTTSESRHRSVSPARSLQRPFRVRDRKVDEDRIGDTDIIKLFSKTLRVAK